MTFIHEEDVQAAYESAEFAVQRLVSQERILLVSYKPADVTSQVKYLAREIADAVIRSQSVEGDIADVPGIHVERVN